MKTREILFNHLLKKEVIVVFDVDGVLAPYEFGDKKHCISDEKWDEMLEKEIDVYSSVQPIKVLQKFIKIKGTENVYVCSVSSIKEYDSKVAFCMKKYSIPEDHIMLVKHKTDKVSFLDALSKKMNLSHNKIALVEDTVETLEQVAKLDFCTVHISSFFNFEENLIMSQTSIQNKNKYQEALKVMCEECKQAHYCICGGFNEKCDQYASLKELVEKAIPAKVIHEEVQSKINEDFYHEFWFCPNCKKITMRKDEHCLNCGQALDWS